MVFTTTVQLLMPFCKQSVADVPQLLLLLCRTCLAALQAAAYYEGTGFVRTAVFLRRFREYVKLCHEQLMPKYKAIDHWAKVEVVDLTPEDKALVRRRMAERYPVTAFNAARKQLDPKTIFSNHIIEDLFPHTGTASSEKQQQP